MAKQFTTEKRAQQTKKIWRSKIVKKYWEPIFDPNEGIVISSIGFNIFSTMDMECDFYSIMLCGEKDELITDADNNLILFSDFSKIASAYDYVPKLYRGKYNKMPKEKDCIDYIMLPDARNHFFDETGVGKSVLLDVLNFTFDIQRQLNVDTGIFLDEKGKIGRLANSLTYGEWGVELTIDEKIMIWQRIMKIFGIFISNSKFI